MFDRMNRRLYWTLINLGKMLGFILGGLGVGLGFVVSAYYSVQWFGTAIPLFALFLLGTLTFVSYKVAAWDVDREKIEKERVERSLKKDW